MKENKESSLIKLAFITDDSLVTRLLTDFFEQNQRVKLVFTAKNETQFLRELERATESLDVVLLGLGMKDDSELDTLRQFREIQEIINSKIIVCSAFYKLAFLGQMIKLGVDAFLPKDLDEEELMEIIYEVYERGHYFSFNQIEFLRDQLFSKTSEHHQQQKDGLTEREIEILILLIQQLTTQEMADRLFISPKTIEAHKTNLMLKTGANGSAELIVYAVENQLIEPAELVFLGA